MKSDCYLIPAPDMELWAKITKKYRIPAIKEYSRYFWFVTLPPGWYILYMNKAPNNYLIYNEDCDRIGMIYMVERYGFTWLDKNMVIKNCEG